MNIHNEDRLARVSRLGKGIQIGQVEARVPARESNIGTGISMRHRRFLSYRWPRGWRSLRLTVFELGALSDLDNVTVRITDVTANLAVLGYWLREEFGSSALPQFIA